MKNKWHRLTKYSFLNRFKNDENGGALLMLLVLIPVFALGAMAAYHYSSNRSDVVYYDFHRQQARYVAEAGLQRLIAEIEFNNAFLTTLDNTTDGDKIERYGLEGDIQLFGDQNPDVTRYMPVQPGSPVNVLAKLMGYFSVTDAQAASYGSSGTYEIIKDSGPIQSLTDPDAMEYTFTATGKTYPTTVYDPTQIDAEVETQIVTMTVAVTNSGITPPPPPTCDTSTVCRETEGEACGTLGNDGLYRYSYYSGNSIGHTGFEVSFFGSNAPLTYHAGNQYNAVDEVVNGTCADDSVEVLGCKDSSPFCGENNDIACTENDDLSGGRSGLAFMNFRCAFFGINMYGTNECIEAESDVRVDCKVCMIFMGTGFQGDYYGDSSTCSDHSPSPVVAFEDVVGPAYGTLADGYSLDSAKQQIINKVTSNGSRALTNGWNTGTGDYKNYHYWKPASSGQNLNDFNFFNTSLLNRKNNVYYIEGSLQQFNLASGDVNILHAFSSGSITIIAEDDITMTSVTRNSFEFMAGGAATLHFIAGNDIKDSTLGGFNFNIGQASEINLIALNDIKLTTIMEFNFSLFGHSGMHVAARNNLSIADGLNFTFGIGSSYYSSKDSNGRGEPSEVSALCDTTGCVEEDDPNEVVTGTLDVSIIDIDFS